METSTGRHSVVSVGHGNLSGLLSHHIVKVMNEEYPINESLVIILTLHYNLFVNMSPVSVEQVAH